jgi:hypothetical protein
VKVPFLSVGADSVGARTERCRGRSQLSGDYVVEDVQIGKQFFRQEGGIVLLIKIKTFAFLTPGSGVRDNKTGSGSGSLETILWIKIQKKIPSQIHGQKDSRIRIRIKECKYLTLKI